MNQEKIIQQCRQLLNNFEYKEALDLLDNNEHLFTDKYAYNLLKSEAYSFTGDGEEALATAEKALAIKPADKAAIARRGDAYWLLGKMEEAEKDFLAAQKLDPDYANIYTGLGNIAYTNREYDKATAYYEKAIEKAPAVAIHHSNLGSVYLLKGDYDKAIEAYNEALKLTNNGWENPYDGLGYAYYYKGDYAKAIEHYQTAVNKRPERDRLRNNLASAYAASGDHLAAIEEYTKAIAINENNSMGFSGRASSYELIGNLARAQEDYNTALKISAENTFAKDGLNRVLGKLGDYKKIERQEGTGYKNSVPEFITQLIEAQLTKEAEPIKEKVMRLGSTVAEAAGEIRRHAFVPNQHAVAHYTKLLVANIIAGKPLAESKLRYYNVAYMNDPEEGKVLLKILQDISPADKRDQIIKCFEAGRKKEDNNVYLGSFVPVSHEDELVMWRTYGRENNVEASGCSIVIGGEFFGGDNIPLQNDFKSMGVAMPAGTLPGQDKEALYQVMYYDKKQDTQNIKINAAKENEVKEGLEKLTGALHKLISLKKGKHQDEPICAVINRIVFRTLSEIRYLFKSADYTYENELRVIQYVDGGSNRVQIDDTCPLPHRLYIESGQPVKPALKKIILGPKVPNPDQWLYLEVKLKREKLSVILEKSTVQFQ